VEGKAIFKGLILGLVFFQTAIGGEVCLSELKNPYPDDYLDYALRRTVERAFLQAGERLRCGEGSEKVSVEVLEYKDEGNKAVCVYGGPAKDKRGKDDFLMYAETKRWEEMGRGEYGPMKAMMLGRLKFEGPKGVAMKNMGPFEAFLTALGKPSYDASKCP